MAPDRWGTCMATPATPKRFRVALSFPGEHRRRVENIAKALADALGRKSILYDRWLPETSGRPNLDLHLTRLYLDESELIVIFLCAEYNAKQWCGLEWRVGRNVLSRKDGAERLMLLKLDDANVEGVLSIDDCLDIRRMPNRKVADAILRRLSAPPPAESGDGFETTLVGIGRRFLITKSQTDLRRLLLELDQFLAGHPASVDAKMLRERIESALAFATGAKTSRAFTSKLPLVNPTLIGRETELALLDAAWADPAANFVQVIAAAGTGKTALIDKWFRRHLGEAPLFGWSFFSQGTSAGRTSSDPFFAEILRRFDIKIEPTASIYAKAEAIAHRLRQERVLLILDGVEPLQDAAGALRDAALKALLQELANANCGLVICTTRVRTEIPDDAPRALSLDLDNLTPQQGAEYLHSLNVHAQDNEELQQASREYWNHPLALTLLGTYLVDFCNGMIERRVEIPELMEHGSHAQRVIAAYEKMFAGEVELDVLRALGYFDRPAEPGAMKVLLPPITAHKYKAALNRLHKARLVLTTDPKQPLDCHPLLREHFAGNAIRENHALLAEYFAGQALEQPDTSRR
jgi:hypothetical protein